MARRSPDGRVNLIAILFRIIWNAPSSVLPALLCACTALDVQTRACMRLRNAHTSTSKRVYQHRVGPKRSMHCCRQPFVCFGADTSRRIFTPEIQQRQKSIGTEFGVAPFCLHSSTDARGTSLGRLIFNC